VKNLLPIVVAAVLCVACSKQARFAYVSDAPRDKAMPIEQTYSDTISAGDMLYINVYSQNAESAASFNTRRTAATLNQQKDLQTSQPGYLVSQSGDIVYPVVGRVAAAGLTCSQLEREMEQRLVEGNFIADPIVSVSLMNFHVTVVGEVQKPQTLAFNGGRATILEALARCGDITVNGIHTNVKIIRPDGRRDIVDSVDLTSRSLFDSPYYYLRSGDIIYVEPTEKRKRIAYRDEDWPQYISIGVSSLRIAYTVVYRYFYNPRTKITR